VYSFNRILNGKVLTALVAAGFMTAVVGCVPPNATAVNSGAQVAPGAETGDPGTFAEAPITEEELEILRANFNRVHFEFDVATFDETTRDLLAQNAAILMRHSAVTVRIEGHADHFGSDEYNLALGQRRAEVVRSYLIALGVQDSRLQLISYGELRPLVGDGDRITQGPNRRAEFVVINGDEVAKSSY
jgi:peptidoglycan-associated lipoprotein